MYHRVASPRHDPWELAVEPDHFEDQIAHLSRYRSPMSMDDMVNRLRSGSLPEDAVAITFDDGYRDNLINAKPILEKHAVPATLFLATGGIERPEPYWWDELADMILTSAGPAQHVERCAGEPVELKWGTPEPLDIAGSWRASDGPKTERQRCYLAMWGRLQRVAASERERVLHALRETFASPPDHLALPMNAGDVLALLSGKTFELGAHSVSHAALASLGTSERREEIAESARGCSALSGKPIRGFAYPYGDIDPDTRDDVERAGFKWACSTRSAFLDGESTDLYMLPRLAVSNVPARLFNSLITR